MPKYVTLEWDEYQQLLANTKVKEDRSYSDFYRPMHDLAYHRLNEWYVKHQPSLPTKIFSNKATITKITLEVFPMNCDALLTRLPLANGDVVSVRIDNTLRDAEFRVE